MVKSVNVSKDDGTGPNLPHVTN